MGRLLQLHEITEKTNLEKEQVIRIAQEFVNKQNVEYEVNTKKILYDVEFENDKEPMWYICVIALKNKVLWPDAYETLIISDWEGVVKYIMTDHGRLIRV